MLTALFAQDGTLRQVNEPLSQAQWIDLLEPTPDETARVTRETGLAVPSEADLSEIESSSRLSTRHGALYLSMPLVSRADTEPRGISAGFILTPDRLITVRFGASRAFDTYMVRSSQDDVSKGSSAHLLVGLLEAIVDRQADALEQVRTELETISHRIFSDDMAAASGRKREDALLRASLVTLGRIGDLLSHIRESQVSAGRIVPYVETAAANWLPAELQPRLHTLEQDIASLNHFDTYLNEKLQFLLDATLGFINIAQNNVMKVLTVVSVVGIPPVLVAGIYGMNFKSMPEYDWSWGYAYGLAMICLTTIVPLAIFRWRNWI
jgi:magnesium transporter